MEMSKKEDVKKKEEENGKSESLENSETETNEFPEPGKTDNGTEGGGRDKSRARSSDNKEENNMEMSKKEDVKKKVPELNGSCSESAPKETRRQRPAKARKKGGTKSEVQQIDDETPKVLEKPEVQRKEEKREPDEQTTTDPVAEEFTKRSIDLAGLGNSFAASGEYETAVKCFTDAIKYNPKELKLFGNRSFCYERMQQYENALRDAELALCMEPKWIKGLFRKGKALCGLKRYYEASLIYKEVLQQQSTSAEAALELERAQTAHLTEMGFTRQQSSEALKAHGSLEGAVESLLGGTNTRDSSASRDDTSNSSEWEDTDDEEEEDDTDNEEGEWITQQSNQSRRRRKIEPDSLSQCRVDSLSLIPRSRKSPKSELHSVWAGFLAPAVNYATLHELFSRAGTVQSIKMLLEHQCAFVKYTKKEECDKAIQCINGMVVEGIPLTVRHPYKINTGLGASDPVATGGPSRPGQYRKECFFWRTTGCTNLDCDYKHDPDHKNIDRDKFTGRLSKI
ncbi:uncharacterized protein si:dkey-33c12.4 [Brachionichthys hirsutus]|uniref:uncharacterized protein si:dkey-33c12.4 n=1 Tax=Brachionichthys hirsutus TaxID=412623 RepID=UPI0036046C7A